MAEQLFTEKEYKEYYQQIKDLLIGTKNKQSAFTLASLIGGQPGSGKSQLSKFIMSQNPNTIMVDGDYIREFHPHLDEIKERFSDNYPKMTQPFVNRTVEQLIDELSKEKYNLIIEGTLRDINIPKETAHMLNERDYIVELYVIATNKELSWQSTIDRGDKMIEEGKVPRYVDRKHHDSIVDRLPETVKELAEQDLFYNVIIMNRETEILYDKNNSNDLDPKKIMENSLNGEHVNSLDDIKRERGESKRTEYTSSLNNISIDKKSSKEIHKNTMGWDMDR